MTEKFEQLLEYVVNDEMDKAQELFHNIVVQKSREIYENLIASEADDLADEEGADADVGDDMDADEVDDLVSDVSDEGGDEDGMDMGSDGEAADAADLEDVEARFGDIEDALSQLKAQFADLMADEAGDVDMGGDDDGFDFDDEAGDVDLEKVDEYGDDDFDFGNEAEDLVMEYTQKVSAPDKSEKQGGNTRSVVAGKNDMGGSAKNLNQGGDTKGRPAPKAKPLTTANTEPHLGKAPAPEKSEKAGGNNRSVQ